MSTQERREREREDLRQKIMAVARELFTQQGYEAVTMRQIADKIEYSATTIYAHFKDKTALVREICLADYTQIAEKFVALAGIEDPVERLLAAAREYVAFALEFPNQYRFLFGPVGEKLAPEEIGVARGNPQEDVYAFLHVTVSQAIAARRLRPEYQDPDHVVQLVWASLHGVIAIALECQDRWVVWRPLRERADLLLEVLTRGLLRDGAGSTEGPAAPPRAGGEA